MILLDLSDKRPLYIQITEQYKSLISLGILKPDEKLPSVRQLAIDMSINPNTIQKAYSELERDGYIYSLSGRGNYVANIEKILPSRKNEYFSNLDEILKKAPHYLLSKKEIIEHVKLFFNEPDDVS